MKPVGIDEIYELKDKQSEPEEYHFVKVVAIDIKESTGASEVVAVPFNLKKFDIENGYEIIPIDEFLNLYGMRTLETIKLLNKQLDEKK